jgi:hypothetical protein
VTLSGTKIKAEKQADGTYLIVLPAGTDITALKPVFALSAGATVSPENGSAQDFSKGPVTYAVTAADKTTVKSFTVAVKTASPAPAEKAYFSPAAESCEVGYADSADGTVMASLRVPLAPGADPAQIDAMKAAITGVTVSDVSYAYVDADGNVVPIEAGSGRSASVTAPYLQIAFAAPSLDALKNAALEKIEYWLKGDASEYVQTFQGGLAFSAMPFTDETPDSSKPEAPDSGGGCDAGAGMGILGMGILGMALCVSLEIGRKRRS